MQGMEALLAPIVWSIATPILVRRLGLETYGQWIVALSLLGLSMLANAGAFESFLVSWPHYRGQGASKKNASNAIALAGLLGLAATTAFIFGVCAGYVANFVSYEQLFPLLILSISIPVKYIDTILQGILISDGKFIAASSTNALANSGATIASVLLVLVWPNLYALAIAQVLAVLSAASFKMWYTRELSGGFWKSEPSEVLKLAREVKKTFLGLWSQSASGVIIASVDKPIVAMVCGDGVVGVYAILQRLSAQVHAVLAQPASMYVPWLATLSANRESAKFERTYRDYERLLFALSLSVYTCVAVGLCKILALWLGHSVEIQIIPLAFACLYKALVNSASCSSAYALKALRQTDLIARNSFYNMVVSISLTLILGYYFGVTGVAVALVLATILPITLELDLERILNGANWMIWKKIGVKYALGISVFATAAAIGSAYRTSVWTLSSVPLGCAAGIWIVARWRIRPVHCG